MLYMLVDTQLHEEMQKLFVNFDKALDSACKARNEKDKPSKCVIVSGLKRNDFNETSTLIFSWKEVALITKYETSDWNRFPIVMPPYFQLMRIEYKDEYRALRKTCGQYVTTDDGDYWIDFDGNVLEFKSLRFRPWGDD